jgi:hypothetical protein
MQLTKVNITVNDIYLVCNHFFYEQFIAWAKNSDFPIENVLNDGTKSNEERLGAVRDIEFAVRHFEISGKKKF